MEIKDDVQSGSAGKHTKHFCDSISSFQHQIDAVRLDKHGRIKNTNDHLRLLKGIQETNRKRDEKVQHTAKGIPIWFVYLSEKYNAQHLRKMCLLQWYLQEQLLSQLEVIRPCTGMEHIIERPSQKIHCGRRCHF